jgi:TolB protein
VYRISIDGGDPQQLTTDPADDYAPNWSPNGSEIAFYSLRTGNRDVFVMNENGQGTQQLTTDPGQDRNPTWSPDGDTIVFASDRTGRNELFLITRPDRSSPWGDPQPVTSDGAFWPRWSPITGEVLYHAEGERSVRALIPSTGESRTIVSGEFVETVRPEWSADGSTVYFAAYGADDVQRIWAVPAGGGSARELVRFDDPVRGQASGNFGVAGNRFLFFINEFESDVWVVELGTP